MRSETLRQIWMECSQRIEETNMQVEQMTKRNVEFTKKVKGMKRDCKMIRSGIGGKTMMFNHQCKMTKFLFSRQ